MLRYAITDISRSIPHRHARLDALCAATRRWAVAGIDYIQLREKSLAAGELFTLAEAAMTELLQAGAKTKLLINARADIALAARCDGVHLTAASGEMSPLQVRMLFGQHSLPEPVVSVSCHNPDEAARAGGAGAGLILFGPVFEKVAGSSAPSAGRGLAELTRAVQAAGNTPVLALGGVTLSNTADCLAGGAAGIAGIRLFN